MSSCPELYNAHGAHSVTVGSVTAPVLLVQVQFIAIILVFALTDQAILFVVLYATVPNVIPNMLTHQFSDTNDPPLLYRNCILFADVQSLRAKQVFVEL